MNAACVLALLPLAANAAVAGDDWRYVLPPSGDPFQHPPLRAISLSPTRPEDVVEMVHYRGTRHRFAQLRYGSPGSIRLTIVLDELKSGEFDLYVDANRNRRIEERDRLAGKGRTWLVPLQVAVVEGEMTRTTPRAALFRLGATALTFSFAAAGYIEGTLAVAGRKHAARRTDGDGNGFLTDAQDRLWIDLDDDGKWDPAAEQFLYAPILTLGEARYAVRSDELGTQLRLEPLAGTGTIKLVLNRPSVAPPLAELRATLIGRDGSAVAVEGNAEGVSVPVGEYRVGTLWLALDDPSGGLRWNFIFSDDEGKPRRKWYEVHKSETIEIDPVGQLELQTGLQGSGMPVVAGDDISLQPRLYTGDGLSINTCFRGTPAHPAGQDGQGAEIDLVDSSHQPLALARSGFR